MTAPPGADRPVVLLSGLRPDEADWFLWRFAYHEAGHAVHWAYGVWRGAVRRSFSHVWVHRTAQEHDESPQIVGAVVPLDTHTEWARARLEMKAASDRPGYKLVEWENLATHHICQCIAGPLAEIKLVEPDEDWWADVGFDALVNTEPTDDVAGARRDMRHVAMIMADFRKDKVGGRLFLDAVAEVKELWNNPGVWACVVKVAAMLRDRGRLSYDEVAQAIGLSAEAGTQSGTRLTGTGRD